MVPEIALTPQMISHFTSRFGENVAVWHSALTDAVREKEWYRMSKGIARIAVCTRSGIFAPLKNVRLIIVDEAHDGSYRSEETGLRYNACEVAELRSASGACVLFGSATPDVTMYHRTGTGEIRLLNLPERAGPGKLPSMRVVDMREERANLAYGNLFSRELKEALAENYASGGQSMLFVGRRGYSSRMFCRDCGRSMICGSCGLPMTFHKGAGRLLCNYCGKTAPAPERCPKCDSPYLGFGSAGTERVERELKQDFPDAEVLRMDSDTVKGRDGHGALLKRFQKEKIPFLVGTQMITKGHDFPGVTLVGIIDADGQINQPEYDAGEKAYQVIAQVAGRAGRGEDPGKVLIQAYNIDDPSIHAAVDGDYKEFYDKELSFRRTMLYPPFCSLCNIRVNSKDDRGVFDYLSALAAAMRSDVASCDDPDRPEGEICVLGPSREAIPKIGDRYRWRLTVKAPDRSQIIALFLRQYAKIKPGTGMRLATVFEN
jgi:primosomal protein N' (replication factor Y)